MEESMMVKVTLIKNQETGKWEAKGEASVNGTVSEVVCEADVRRAAFEKVLDRFGV